MEKWTLTSQRADVKLTLERKDNYRKSNKITKPLQKKEFLSLKYEGQSDGRNSVQTRCAQTIGIFAENFSCLSYIAAEKINFPQSAKG